MARPKTCKLKPSRPLPITGKTFKGHFNGFCVVVDDEDDMKTLTSMGYFGKATLSRNYPNFQHHKPEIIRRRVFVKRKGHSGRPQKVVVVPDSSGSDSEYFTNLKPQFEIDNSGIKEVVNLALEEAFFLAGAINRLVIWHNGALLSVDDIWTVFQQSDKYFVQNYVAYYYFRARNWVVKPGIKFGGDFLLYKQGPPFYHASYVVIIYIVDENLKKIEDLNRRSMEYSCLMGLHRLCETSGKELLICEIIWPKTLPNITFQDLNKFTIKETVMKRWISSQERQCDND